MKTEHNLAAISVRGLRKNYKGVPALDGVTFDVKRGELLAYLGPNGAGKTTTINILSGLLPRDSGDLAVCGVDVAKAPVRVKQLIGVVPEESNLYPELTSRGNLLYVGELYGLPRAKRALIADQILDQFCLSDKSNMPFRTLSRGMKRRLTIAAALVHSPEVLFLDEPTAGLDVQSARQLRAHVRNINQRGTTVLLTTHNLLEASELCTRILILIKGRIVAEGSASEIAERLDKAKRLAVKLSGDVDEAQLREHCPSVMGARLEGDTFILDVIDTHSAIAEVVSFSEKRSLQIVHIRSATPSLEDTFVKILEEHDAGDGGPR
ncbi:ABC transporter ATP-binding protein [bacterium]|nr:ABC transporter ATP-binding protein [bacterium]